MRAGQPLAQPVGRFVWCGSVERHQRGGHAGNPNDAGAPPVLRDGRDLEQVWLPENGFLKTMHGSVHVGCFSGSEAELYARGRSDQAKPLTKVSPRYPSRASCDG